jgi:hypothetical protein
MRKVIQARDTLIEIADFFHDVAHQKDLVISRGMTIAELARNANVRAPRSLRAAEVLRSPSKLSKPREGLPFFTVTKKQRPRPGVIEFKKCVEVGTTSGPVSGSVKVCINCSVIKRQCTITIEATGTIVIG